MHPANTFSRNTSLDALRGAAIAMVVLHHAYPAFAPAGYLGVDLFFVLAGFFLAQSAARPSWSLRAYLADRFWRLFPAAFAATTVTLAVAWFVLLPDELSLAAQNAFYSLGFAKTTPPDLLMDISILLASATHTCTCGPYLSRCSSTF